MGNYYNFYAATAGSGTSSFTGEAPDSICPKGWRMVGNEGEKSGINLFANYYGGTHENGNDNGTNIDTHLLSNVFYFLRSGEILNGIIPTRESYGYNWSMKTYSERISACYFSFGSTWLTYQNAFIKGRGQSLRCVAKLKLFVDLRTERAGKFREVR